MREITLELISEARTEMLTNGDTPTDVIVPVESNAESVIISGEEFCFKNIMLRLNDGKMKVGTIMGMDLWVDDSIKDKVYMLNRNNIISEDLF